MVWALNSSVCPMVSPKVVSPQCHFTCYSLSTEGTKKGCTINGIFTEAVCKVHDWVAVVFVWGL